MALEKKRLTDAQYAAHFADVHPPFGTKEGAQLEANRCLFCYDAPCMKSCPTHIEVPKFIRQIASEDTKGAAKTIFDANILGAGCSKVCPVEKLCEGACVYNLMGEKPIEIARLQRYATEKALDAQWQFYQAAPPTGHRVAIVGAGPAGLACAHALARAGVAVTIFEKEAKGGGLMTYGVAAYKVTPEFCAQEVDYITSIGHIDIRYGQALGRDMALSDLQAQYDAVFLAFGVGATRRLDIAGEDFEGVVDALSFIYQLRTQGPDSVAVGDQVVVIGLGMTAIDAATQAKRLGAAQVTLVYRRTEAEKPCTDAELNLAKLDGCQIVYLAAPKAILGKNDRVTGLECRKMQLGTPDAKGRRQPVATDETFVLAADMVIKATGQLPYTTLVTESVLAHQDGKISLKQGAQTHTARVFAGGDCVNGGKEVVDAVQAGKLGANDILMYLGIAPLSNKTV